MANDLIMPTWAEVVRQAVASCGQANGRLMDAAEWLARPVADIALPEAVEETRVMARGTIGDLQKAIDDLCVDLKVTLLRPTRSAGGRHHQEGGRR